MKTFKYWLQEAAAAKVDNPGKNFEVDIVNYINAKGQGEWSKEVVSTGDSALKLGTTEAITADDYTSEYQSGFKHSPLLGKKSEPKADILFKIKGKWTPISVKMDGSIVIASAQNTIEFENIFLVTIQLYEKLYGNKGLDSFKKLVTKTSNEVVGQVYNSQELTSGRIKSLMGKMEKLNYISKKQLDDVKKSIESNAVLAKEEARGGVFYEEIMNGMESFSKNFGTNIDKISGMKELIVWEGITAYNKYNPNLSKDGKSFKNIKNSEFDGRKTPTLAWANYVISPSGLHDVSDNNGSYIRAAAKASKIKYRGLPTGGIRSSAGGEKFIQQAFSPNGIFGIPDNDTFKQFFKNVGVFAMNMKIDTNVQQIMKTQKEIEDAEKKITNESTVLVDKLIECRNDMIKNENLLNEKMILFESNNSPELIQEIKFIRNLIDKGKQLFGKLKNKFKSVLKTFTEKMKMFYRKLVEHTKTFFDMIANLSLTEASLMFKMTLASDSKIKLP